MISHEVKYFVDSRKKSGKVKESDEMALKKGSFDFEEHMEKYDLEVGYFGNL